ncbi:GDP-mannose 4,6-dehydratase [Ramlibacter sp. H39-3-26]|uniref:GDP-mannose 4,6-dehydratase n=1 Tax=Curvibacter soli TaxID=3031331 RepID=UPI0023DC435E|nr:GDP-mannose 4,6-dehydratase [Ramlibacter sp. H39-3-26]MDF1485191.1 GDP-mannose 4,6-dehydratase [Ramlibacter sp. H39-3-26]
MCIFATGLNGFVGRYCAEMLQAKNLAVDGISADLRNTDELCAALDAARPDAIIHLAAQSSVPEAFNDPLSTFDVNFTGTFNLLRSLERTGFRGRLIYVGTGDVYGKVNVTDLPIKENMPLRPRNPYAVSKLAAEALCYQWSQGAAFEIIMTRPFNHIGPRQGTQFAVANFAQQICRYKNGFAGNTLTVGDIDSRRDFTDVRDVVQAYAALLAHGINGEIYNICSGVERELRSLLTKMLDLAKTSMVIVVDSGRIRPIEQRRVCGSSAKLQKHTGWHPEISIDQTLQDILDYWSQLESA